MTNFVQLHCEQAIIASHPATEPCPKSAGPWILLACILGSSMVFIDGTVVNVALPSLQKSLGATVLDAQWVVEAYALPLAALLLVGGSLGDLYGRRRIFMVGVFLFAVASLWCGCASNIQQLIAARALQGVGGALLVPGSLAIIGAAFRGEARGRAIGTWSGFTAMTASIGPVLGGWLIEHVSWRAVFFLNLPLAAMVLSVAWLRVPESHSEEESGRLDWPGAALATIGLGSLVYGLIESSRLGFAHPAVAASLGLGGVFLAAFLFFEGQTKHPMLPLILFRSRDFSGSNLLTLLLYGALGGTLFFVPLNLIQVQKYSATAAGAALLPLILIMFLLSRWSSGLVQRYGARLPLVLGPMVAGVGFALFALPGREAFYWTTFFPAMVVLGFGMALTVAPLTTTVMNAVPASRVGSASGINNAIARAAGLLAVAVFGILMLHQFNISLKQRLSASAAPVSVRQILDEQRTRLAGMTLPRELAPGLRRSIETAVADSFITGFRAVMLTGAGLALFSGLIALALISGRAQPLGQSDQRP